MKKSELYLSILAVGLALGTAWAVRGRFGHEQGAAWAGGIGALCLVVVAKRQDWYNKIFKIAMAAAFGWGISGVMSYGIIVGYGRATDFINAYYGLLMLFVLGVLYGFLGGGLFGLSLMDSRENKVPWHAVLTQMIALGLLTYAVLIMQLEWFMTPPRSEMWAACLGASIALGWFIIRNKYQSVLKVAIWSALGAGFGFAFGNFLQVLGAASGVKFNFWNVMEYSIGFFGGIGMAYGTFTSPWPDTKSESNNPNSNLLPILFVALLIPFAVWDQSFVAEKLDFITESGAPSSLIPTFQSVVILCVLAMTGFLLYRNYSTSGDIGAQVTSRQFFIVYTALYILFSFLITGVWTHPLEQYLYVLNLVAILFLIPRTARDFPVYEFRQRRWVTVAVVSVAVIALLAFIAINSHEGLRGSNIRFGNK